MHSQSMVSRYGRNAVAVLSLCKRQNTEKMHNKRQISVKSAYYSIKERRKDRLNIPEMACLSGFFHGARDGTRTHDLLITNQLRYQLRHSSLFGFRRRSAAYVCLLYNILRNFSSHFSGFLPRAEILRRQGTVKSPDPG